MTPCSVSQAENKAAARIERTDALLDLAYGTLMCQYMAATLAPLVKIPTPAWVDDKTSRARRLMRNESRLIDVLSDQMAGIDSDDLWSSLVGVLVKTAEGREWLRDRATEYADFHAMAAAYGDEQ